MMSYIDDFVQKTMRLKQIEEENIRISKERSKILRGYDSLTDLAFQEAGFEPTSIEINILGGIIYKHEKADIYIHHGLDMMRVWMMPDDTEEFRTYLENDEFLSEEEIRSTYPIEKNFNQWFTLGGGILGGILSVPELTELSGQDISTKEGLLVAAPLFIGIFGGLALDVRRYIVNGRNKRKELDAALERHERFKPKYEEDMALDYLLKAYGTRHLDLNS